MAKRTYIPTIVAITRRLCQVIGLATPIIRRLYPDNALLLSALDTANVACAELNKQASAVREFGD